MNKNKKFNNQYLIKFLPFGFIILNLISCTSKKITQKVPYINIAI